MLPGPDLICSGRSALALGDVGRRIFKRKQTRGDTILGDWNLVLFVFVQNEIAWETETLSMKNGKVIYAASFHQLHSGSLSGIAFH